MKGRLVSIVRSSRLANISALFFSFCCGNLLPCCAGQQSLSPAEKVEIPIRPLPFTLRGFLRRPEDKGRSPAVVLLPACGEYAKPLDEDWGARISSWGYVTLTIDGFGPRAIKHCDQSVTSDPSELAFDAYRGLNFLIQKSFVDSKHVAVVGFAWGAWQALAAVERGAIEQASEHKFRAAAAFYPLCASFKGVMTVPTLVLIGERDDRDAADACRKMVAGEDDMGISRQKNEGAPVRLIVYPEAYFAFAVPSLKNPTECRGRDVEFNKSAADQSREALRQFLISTVGAGSN
jgi:dienelactone hydrolase